MTPLFEYKTMPFTLLGAVFASAIAFPITVMLDYVSVSVWFVVILAGVVSIDFVVASYWAATNRSFSGRVLWEGVKKKVVGYGLGLMAVHGLSFFLILKANMLGDDYGIKWLSYVAVYIDCAVYCAILVNELLSIVGHLSKFGIRVLPKFILAKLEKFDESGNLKDLKELT